MRAYQLIDILKSEAESRFMSFTYDIDPKNRNISFKFFGSRFRYSTSIKLDALHVTRYEEAALVEHLVNELDTAYNNYLRGLYV